MNSPVELPMFPLSTVLFPGQPIPLNVFEPRYRAMMADIGPNGEFGICLIERGSEVGGGDVRTSVGTVAQVQLLEPIGDEMFFLFASGQRRFVVEEWLGEVPYPRARVRFLEDDEMPSADILQTAISSVRAVRHLESEIDMDTSANSVCEFDEDPITAAWQCCSFPHMATMDRQSVLQTEHVDDRLRLVAEICCERYGDLQRLIQLNDK